MVNFEEKEMYSYADLLEMIRVLRSPDGCPWDRVQTHESLRRGMLEEAYEAVEAIDLKDPALLCEELGDVLMQVVFHASLAQDAGQFTMDDVVDGVVKKLLYRHPHVFGELQAHTPEQVLVSWDQLKRREKGQRSTADAMDSVARSLPGLWRAEKILSKAAKAGFDWPDAAGALDKLSEETGELREAVEQQSNVSEELGDVLLAAVKVGLRAGVDPEEALSDACEKFIRRFRLTEEAAAAGGQALSELSGPELTALWKRVKQS